MYLCRSFTISVSLVISLSSFAVNLRGNWALQSGQIVLGRISRMSFFRFYNKK